MAATSAINTPMIPQPDVVEYPVAAATTLYAGTLLAIDSSGNVVSAADTAGLRVLGRCEADVDNSAGAAGDLNVLVRRGVFRYANSGTYAVDADDKGKLCYIEDNQTVAETSTNKIPAGRVHNVDSDGVWVDTRNLGVPLPIVITVGSTNSTFGAAADLAAVKVEGEKLGDDLRALLTAMEVHGFVKLA